MSTPEIIRKLTEQIDAGMNTEVQVVYVLAGIRKIIERGGLRARFKILNFHCDWVLHALLDRADARRVLALFDAAHPLLKGDVKLSDLPANLRPAITELSHMQSFEAEIEQFCADYGLPSLQPPPQYLVAVPVPIRRSNRGHFVDVPRRRWFSHHTRRR